MHAHVSWPPNSSKLPSILFSGPGPCKQIVMISRSTHQLIQLGERNAASIGLCGVGRPASMVQGLLCESGAGVYAVHMYVCFVLPGNNILLFVS